MLFLLLLRCQVAFAGRGFLWGTPAAKPAEIRFGPSFRPTQFKCEVDLALSTSSLAVCDLPEDGKGQANAFTIVVPGGSVTGTDKLNYPNNIPEVFPFRVRSPRCD